MALRAISEQQFRTRRKDRRMIWVDAVAVLIGTLLVAATVGAVVLVEPEPQPIGWDYSFFAATDKEKHCAGLSSTVTAQAGCTDNVATRKTSEGETVPTTFPPVASANVTRVLFTLSWVDDIPVQDCEPDCSWKYPYTNESTDILRLIVHPPNGEPQIIEGANDLNTLYGSIALNFDFLATPEAGSFQAFGPEQARGRVQAQFTQPVHDALGEWKAEVTLVRAGDQQGTIPIDACAAALEPTGQEVPEPTTPLTSPADRPCQTEDHRGTLEDDPVGQAALRMASYQGSYEDTQQSWVLEMAIQAYDTQITVA